MATYFEQHQKPLVIMAIIGAFILIGGVYLGNWQNNNIMLKSDRNFQYIVESANMEKEEQEEEARQAEEQRQQESDRVIRFVSIYLCDIEEDIDKIKAILNVTNNDRATNNGTHIKIDSRYELKLPIECLPNPSPS